MDDYNVIVTEFKHQTSTDQLGRFRQNTRVSIKVGAFGPFTKEFDDGPNQMADIQQWIAQKKSDVQVLCAIK